MGDRSLMLQRGALLSIAAVCDLSSIATDEDPSRWTMRQRLRMLGLPCVVTMSVRLDSVGGGSYDVESFGSQYR